MSSLKLKTKFQLKKNLDQLLIHQLSGKAESLKIGVIHGSKNIYTFKYGKDYKFYDVASLTKVIFTVSAFMYVEKNLKSIIQKPVVDLLPWFKGSSTIKVIDLLAHQSGAPALYPVFKNLNEPTLDGLTPLNLLIRDQVSFDSKEVIYSDVGFFVLGAILESVFNKPLRLIFEDLKKQFDFNQMHFNPVGENLKYPVKSYAPSENCPLRHKIIQGEVHDENCWKMGGVGPHAGLFASIDDVLVWLKGFMNPTFLKTQSAFFKKQKGDWRLGLMVPSRPTSSCGQYFSDHSFGHLGFTGTSFWVDPKVNLGVVILSNRTFPDRNNKDFNILRPLIHDIVYKTIQEN